MQPLKELLYIFFYSFCSTLLLDYFPNLGGVSRIFWMFFLKATLLFPQFRRCFAARLHSTPSIRWLRQHPEHFLMFFFRNHATVLQN